MRAKREKASHSPLHGQHNLVQGTPDHCLFVFKRLVGPILWRALVTRGRRNARKGVGHSYRSGLRYVLIPRANRALAIRPDRSRCRWENHHQTMAVGWFSGWVPSLTGVKVGCAPFSGAHNNKDTSTGETQKCCDALRCSGPHARYTDEVSEFITLAGRSG